MMSMLKSAAAFGFLVLMTACSTAVDTRIGPPKTPQGSALKVDAVKVSSRTVAASPDVQSKLLAAVQVELAKRSQGAQPARLEIEVTDYSIVSGGNRFVGGMFAGGNRMSVSVKAIGADDKVLADFDVRRSANPGGYGVFYDQAAATINAVATGIADTLEGKSP